MVSKKSAIFLLQDLGIESQTFSNRVGIWVTKSNGVIHNKEKKIGAIGLRKIYSFPSISIKEIT